MTDASGNWAPANGVRPAFRTAAIVVFAVLLPVSAHRLWDYVELRRLVGEIQAIQAKGEPVSEAEATGAKPFVGSEAKGAGPFYLAGAMLALGRNPNDVVKPIRDWMADPSPDWKSLPALTMPLQQYVDESEEALMLADKASALPFEGFPAGTEYSYLAASVRALNELNVARTLSRSLAGDGDAAVESALSGLQIRRALRDSPWLLVSNNQVDAILSLTRPSPQALSRLQSAIEADYRPNEPIELFLRARARYIERIWRRYYGSEPTAPHQYSLPMRSLQESLMRPWLSHRIVEDLRIWAELTAVVRAPWPGKSERSAAILARYREELGTPGSPYPVNRGAVLGALSQAVDATHVVVDLSTRLAVAVERFRRDQQSLPATLEDLVPRYLPELPIDPFTGRALLFKLAANSYTIYSVGPNLKDDGGDLTSESRSSRGRAGRDTPDLGIRVITEH